MKKLNKKNNKGFSLVELIVVILIMAIIAVALAPQVMKWVGKSSKSTDENNTATIKSAASTAVADYQAMGNTITATVVYEVVPSEGLKLKDTADSTAQDTPNSPASTLLDCILEVMNGDFPEVKENTNNRFFITVTKDTGAVKVEVAAKTAAPVTP